MTEPLFFFLAMGGLAVSTWILGWHYGAKSLRNRHARLIKVIEGYNEDAQKRDKRTGNNWYDGYHRGIADTLNTLERFLDKFKE